MANYESQFTGEQIDNAVGKVDEKLDKTGGTVSITPSGATTPASKVVSFGKTFSAPPKVILTATNSEKAHVFSWSTSNITTTQFTAHVSNSVGAYPSHANWIAIGI